MLRSSCISLTTVLLRPSFMDFDVIGCISTKWFNGVLGLCGVFQNCILAIVQLFFIFEVIGYDLKTM